MALEQEYLLKQEEAEETYQKKLTAGSGININPTTNVISATGGGGSSVTYTSEYPQGETIGILEINDVQNPIQMPELIPGDNVTITQDVTTGALTIDSTGGGNVDDVKIGNTSIVDANKIANIPTMTGATSQAAGSAGVVPAPLAADVDKFLKADGTWDDCSSATELTKAQYDALPSSKESDGVLYMINDIDTMSGITSDLTRAAYDLLPASKESDDIFYYITDEGVIMHNGVQYAGGGSGGSSNLILDARIYSTDEKQVGVWIDNKPLYAKTITFSEVFILGTPNQWYKTTIQQGNEEQIIKVEGTNIASTYSTAYSDLSGAFDEGVLQLLAHRYSELNSITIYYTKTNDTAGSGGYQAYGFSPIIYSTEEREVGVWIDNKPLYQKTTYFGAISTDANYGLTMDIGANIVDTVIDMFANAKVSSGAWVVLPYPLPNANYAAYLDGYNKSTDKLTIKTGNARSFVEGYATIYYTKTTDVAGSGSYNTLGVPAHHYDGNEKVVGTWFGETLYEKTFIWTLAQTIQDTTITIDTFEYNQNIKNYSGMATESGVNYLFPYVANNAAYGSFIFRANGNIEFVVYRTSFAQGSEIRLTVQYTKTID